MRLWRPRIHSSSAFCSIWALDRVDDAHSQWRGHTLFTRSTNSKANLFQKHFYRQAQRQCFAYYLVILEASHVDT